MQTHHIAAFLKGFHTVLRADDDRLCPKANTRDRASRIALTEPSISGTLWGSNTNPTRIYTRSPGWMALHNASAACMAVGSPVYARLPAYKMRHTP